MLAPASRLAREDLSHIIALLALLEGRLQPARVTRPLQFHIGLPCGASFGTAGLASRRAAHLITPDNIALDRGRAVPQSVLLKVLALVMVLVLINSSIGASGSALWWMRSALCSAQLPSYFPARTHTNSPSLRRCG